MSEASDDPALEAALARLSKRAGRLVTLPELIQRWTDFADEVGSGYRASIYDYTNELSVRDLLAEVIAALQPDAGRD